MDSSRDAFWYFLNKKPFFRRNPQILGIHNKVRNL